MKRTQRNIEACTLSGTFVAHATRVSHDPRNQVGARFINELTTRLLGYPIEFPPRSYDPYNCCLGYKHRT